MNRANATQEDPLVTVSEDREQEGTSSFYDPANPVFAPPKPKDTRQKKTWKRKLITLCVVLLLIAGGVLALYLVLRVKQVDVRVQADSRREGAGAKAEPSPNNSENGLSAEAINIARQAIGADTSAASDATSPSAIASASPVASDIPQSLSFTDNSPAYAHPNEAPSITGNSSRTGASGAEQPPREFSAPAVAARASSIETLFVDDRPLKPLPSPQLSALNQTRVNKNAQPSKETSKNAPAVLPLFGTLLPVRTQGVIFSLRKDSFARLELSRDCQGEGWSLPKGTLLIGRVNGSEHDRAFINIQGYLDPRTNRLVKMTGEVLGSDGGAGMQGKRVVVDRNRLKQTLSKVASGGLQVAGMMAGALTGRGTVVLNGGGYRALNPIADDAASILNVGTTDRSFVKIEAGQPAYVMVADLPKELQAVDAPGTAELTQTATQLTDSEVMELILFGSHDDLRAALPLMNDEQKRLVLKSISDGEIRNR